MGWGTIMNYAFLVFTVMFGSTFNVTSTYAEAPAHIEPVVIESNIEQEPPSPVEEVNEGIYCSCIHSARAFGLNLPRGDAKDLVPNSIPTQGGGILLSYPSAEHVAFISAVLPGGVWVQEGNFRRCQYTERFIPFTDPRIRGFVAF